MSIVIVPNVLSERINEKLDAAYKDCPEAAIDRDVHYHELLTYFDEHGRIPDFSLKKVEGGGE